MPRRAPTSRGASACGLTCALRSGLYTGTFAVERHGLCRAAVHPTGPPGQPHPSGPAAGSDRHRRPGEPYRMWADVRNGQLQGWHSRPGSDWRAGPVCTGHAARWNSTALGPGDTAAAPVRRLGAGYRAADPKPAAACAGSKGACACTSRWRATSLCRVSCKPASQPDALHPNSVPVCPCPPPCRTGWPEHRARKAPSTTCS